MSHQDWAPLQIRSAGAVRAAQAATTAAVSAARSAAAAAAAERDDGPPKPSHRTLSAESRAELVRLRASERKLSQAQLNTLCSFPPNTIRDFENGRISPTPTQLNVLNRVLHAALKYA